MSMDVTALLTFAIQSGASDVHLSSGQPPMIRLDGSMKRLDHPALSRDEVHALIYDIMNDGQRNDFEETLELDFSFDLGNVGRFRVNVFMQQRGEGAVFRTIPTEIPSFEKLGLPPLLKQLCERGKGLILVTGPTGSGKCSNLAAMVDHINSMTTLKATSSRLKIRLNLPTKEMPRQPTRTWRAHPLLCQCAPSSLT